MKVCENMQLKRQIEENREREKNRFCSQNHNLDLYILFASPLYPQRQKQELLINIHWGNKVINSVWLSITKNLNGEEN